MPVKAGAVDERGGGERREADDTHVETERDTINIVRDTPIGNDEGGRRSGQGFVLHADIFIIFFLNRIIPL